MTSLRIAFAGTPQFALPALRALLDSPHRVVGVLTQPDRPAGRGRELRASPIKLLAAERGVPVAQPATLRTPEAVAPLREWSPDIAARILGTNRWLNNPDSAAHVMWPRAADALSVMHASAAGHDPADAINGPKTYAFDKTLLDPDYPGAVVDAWMIQALSGRQASSSGGANIAPGEIDVHVLDQPNTTPGPKTQYKEAWEPRGTVYTLASAAVEQAADERGMAMAFTAVRHFRH